MLLFDEIDSLAGPALSTFLTQLREGYLHRSNSSSSRFPRSIALIGLRDISEYRDKIYPEEQSLGLAIPFDIITESFSLPNFSLDDIAYLYSQHTVATGQNFEKNAIDRAWYWSEGQPWLANALAYEAVENQLKNNFSIPVTESEIDTAAHAIMLSNREHIRSIRHRLQEYRVIRTMEAVIIGSQTVPDGITQDDFRYSEDLGLLKNVKITLEDDTQVNAMKIIDGLKPSNPIYKNIIFKMLTDILQSNIPIAFIRPWTDGHVLDMNGLLRSFQTFWRLHSGMLTSGDISTKSIELAIRHGMEHYERTHAKPADLDLAESIKSSMVFFFNEALSHLVILSFLQRLLNGGVDNIEREVALGSGRLDICVYYKKISYPIELKINGVSSFDSSLKQLLRYMDHLKASEGWLVIFDNDANVPWEGKIRDSTVDFLGKTIHVFFC